MMPVRLLSKKWWALLGAAWIAACLFCPPLTIAAEGTPATGEQLPSVETSQAVDAPATPSGEAVWESSPPATGPGEAPAPQEGEAVDESASRKEGVQEEVGSETVPEESALPVFDVAGIAIGMDLGDAKEIFDQLLGFESTVRSEAMADSLQLDGNGYAVITGDANQRVIRIEFGQKFIDAVYQAEGLKPKEFVDKFSKYKGIVMDIDITRRHTAWEYTAFDAVKVTITSTDTDNKVLIVEKN